MVKRFRVALSFPSEHRAYVAQVARSLADTLTEARVFYDEWYEVELLGVGGDLKLRAMYEQADLVVPFFSSQYSKPWCLLEWDTIREILLLRRKEDSVIPVHLDDTAVPGWSSVNFGIRHKGRTPQEIAAILLEALRFRETMPVPSEPGSTDYYCYISAAKLDQLLAATTPSNEEIECSNPSRQDPEVPYGRPDLFQRDGGRKRQLALRLSKLLPRIESAIRPFEWAGLAEHSLFRCRLSFTVSAIDESNLMAKLVATNKDCSLTLHCSLSNFSHATIANGKPCFQSTNYGFFTQVQPVTFDSVFLVTSFNGYEFFGSPIFLKLPITTGLSL
jgi:hypothetical protein